MIGYDDDEDAMPLGLFIALLCVVGATVFGVAVLMVGLTMSFDLATVLDAAGVLGWLADLIGWPAR